MDEEGDVMLPVPGMKEFLAKGQGYVPGDHLTEVAVGSHLLHYTSLLVYTHFKGHAMGGFGGSLKNIGIGIASGHVGKAMVHGFDFNQPNVNFMDYTGPVFLERMVESGKATTEHFKGHIIYINVLKNISIDCDCNGSPAAPKMEDIGILASLDPVALDKACVDLVYAAPEDQSKSLISRIEQLHGTHTLDYAEEIGLGTQNYELVDIDE
jgi:uncharacterized Fe-S center protein